MKRIVATGLAACAATLGAPANLWANTVAETPVLAKDNLEPRNEGGKQVYEVSQFLRFAPQTAADLAGQIPGFSITQVSADRGLGEASQNVLINGQRITGKGSDAQAALTRIPVSTVTRLEIIDGATLDISGLNGQVLNVVTREGGLKGNFAWRPQFRRRIDANWFNAEANLSGKLGKGSFTLGVNNNGSFRGGGWGEETARDTDGNIVFIRDQFGHSDGDRPRIAGTYNVKSDAGSIFNASGALEFYRFRNEREYDRQAPGQADILERSSNSENEWNMELGADYDLALAGGRLKIIGFHRFEHSPVSNSFRSDYLDGRSSTAQRFDQVIDEAESVARVEYRWKDGKTDWQISAEGAHNYLDAASEFFVLDNLGEFQSVGLPNATSRVEEKRAQTIISYGRPVSANLTLQATMGGEYSQLSQSGANGLKRTFLRPKGSVSLALKASPRLDASLKIQRKVGQLNFGDFLASVDVRNNNNNAGNPRLVPPQSWLANLEANRSLGTAGSIKLKIDAELISDIVDQIPVSPTEEAPGNLNSAKRVHGEINTSFILDSLGFPGAKLDATLALQAVSLRDPLTGLNRPISNRGRSYWNIDFRHDIPGTAWAWGFFAEDSSDYGFYRLDYFGRDFRTGPFALAFVENKDVLGLKVRGTIQNLWGQQERYKEIFYVDRRDGPIDYSTTGTNKFGLIYRLQVSGTF